MVPTITGLRALANPPALDRAAVARESATATAEVLRNGVEDAAVQAYLYRRGLEQRYQLERTGEETRIEAAITDTFNGVVAAAVTLIVGIYVFSQISNTMPEPSNSDLANATDTVETTTGDAFTLGAVALIVMVAALILALIGGSFGGGGMRR